MLAYAYAYVKVLTSPYLHLSFNTIYFILDLSQACKTGKMFEFIVVFGLETERKEEPSSTLRRRNLKTERRFHSENAFLSTLGRRKKTQKSTVILYLCLRKIREGKSRYHRDYIFSSIQTTTKSRRFEEEAA